MNKPICHFLIGLPGTGKSFWYEENFCGWPIYSTDKIIEELADTYTYVNSKGKYEITYNDIFPFTYKFAEYINEHMLLNFIQSLNTYQSDLIWDQTNLTKKSRRVKIEKIKNHYEIHAYVFTLSDESKHKQILKSREGKVIDWDTIILPMMKRFEFPSFKEGFSKIILIKDFKEIT